MNAVNNTPDDYEKIASTIRTIRKSLAYWQAIVRNSNYDKKGVGINCRKQYHTFVMELTIDSWAGTYGNSGCGCVLYVGDAKIFQRAFETVLSRNLLRLLAETANELEENALPALRNHRAKLLAEIEQLTEIEQTLNAKAAQESGD